MRMAARIQQIRLQRYLTLEEVAAAVLSLLADAMLHLHLRPSRWRRNHRPQPYPPAGPSRGSAISEQSLTKIDPRDHQQ
jgi:hypothetical protein